MGEGDEKRIGDTIGQALMQRLAGKRALITGAGGDIGRAIALALAAEGAALLLTDLDKARASDTAAQHGAVSCAQDVRREEDWERVIALAVERMGGLDILVNNAGIEIAAYVADIDADNASEMLAINLLGPILGTKHGFRAMRPGGVAGGGGSIVNVASAAGVMTPFGVSVYGATKAGLMHFSRTAAVEAGRMHYGIRVNCVLPGLIDSAMGRRLEHELVGMGVAPTAEAVDAMYLASIPLGRLGNVADCAAAVVYLCSDDAAYVTGVNLRVDGGVAIA